MVVCPPMQGPTRSVRASYEASVGGRTSIRLLNKKWTHNYGRSHQELLLDDLPSRLAGNSYTLLASRGNVAEFRLLWEAAQAIAVNEQRYPTQPLFVATRTTSHAMDLVTTFRAGMQCATGKRYRGKNAASSGLLGLFMLLQRCQAISRTYRAPLSFSPSSGSVGHTPLAAPGLTRQGSLAVVWCGSQCSASR